MCSVYICLCFANDYLFAAGKPSVERREHAKDAKRSAMVGIREVEDKDLCRVRRQESFAVKVMSTFIPCSVLRIRECFAVPLCAQATCIAG